MQGIPQGQGSQQGSGGSQKPSLSWQSPASGASKAPMQNTTNKPKAPPPVMQNTTQGQSSMGLYIGIFIGGLIVGGIAGSLITGQHMTPAASSDMSTTTGEASSSDMMGSAMGGLQGLSIASGQEAGGVIGVSNVNVTQPTWVVIYDDQNGVPGRALGAQLFFPVSMGGATSGDITLVRNTLAGTTYLAGERIDDGDHAYSPASDKAVSDANGNPLTISFSIK